MLHTQRQKSEKNKYMPKSSYLLLQACNCMHIHGEDFKKYYEKKKKLKVTFKDSKSAFLLTYLLLQLQTEPCLIEVLPKIQEGTLQLSTTEILCTGVWKRNHSCLHFSKMGCFRKRRIFLMMILQQCFIQ